MPKTYSQQERARIRQRLHEEAAVCVSAYGIKGTTVDMLVQRVDIPKGTFYLFFPSKEELIFDTFLELHRQQDEKFQAALSAFPFPHVTCDQMTDLVWEAFRAARTSPLLRVITSGEIALLAKKLPPEVLAEHFSQDENHAAEILSLLPHRDDTDVALFSAALRELFVCQFPQNNGELKNDEALRLLIRGLFVQFMA